MDPAAENSTPQPAEKQKPLTVDLDIVSDQDAFKLSPEQQAAKDRLDKRAALALPIINTVIPTRTLDQFQHSVARYFLFMDKPENMQKAEAARRLQIEPKDRESLAYRLAQSDIQDSELENYITTIYGIAQDISPNNSGVEIDDIKGLSYVIENVEQSHIFKKYAEEWKQRFLTGVDDETVDQRMHDITDIFSNFSGSGRSPKPEPIPEKDMDDLFGVITSAYEFSYAMPNDEASQKIAGAIPSWVKELGVKHHSAIQAEQALEIFKNAANNPNKELVEKFIEHVAKYGRHHEITEDAVRGLSTELFPALERQDPQVDILLRGGNIWGMKDGDFGAGDFLVHCYALKVAPQNLSELLLVARDVPATTAARMEQNRLDGLSLANPFGNLRDFIHDQRPHVHDLISAMVHYYDTGDRSQIDEVLPKTDYFNSVERVDMLYDRSLYDRVIQEVRNEERVDSGMKSIDFLRRVKENTEPIPDEPPQTTDSRLNQAMRVLSESKRGEEIPRETLSEALDYTNTMLLSLMQKGEVGIDPNHIHALSWLERQVFKKLQGLTYEEQSGAYRQDWFISILRFQELTCSPDNFDETKFQEFITKLQQAKSDREAYQLIGTRALENVYQLAKIQSEKGRKDIGGLWSGNLPHELIGLIDPKPAETEVGRRARKEDIKRLTEPMYHPGD